MSIARVKHASAGRRTSPVPLRREPAADRPGPEFPDAQAAILAAKDEIIAGLIVKAKQGSYLHAKFLFDFAGLSGGAESAAEACAHEASLAQLLLDQLTSEGISLPSYKPATAKPSRESV